LLVARQPQLGGFATPTTSMHVLSTKRVMEAAVVVANAELGTVNRLALAAPQRVAGGSQQTPSHATGQGRA
jgi:hypothetical protein